MSRLAACPKCRNQFTLPELAGSATIACPFCGAHINIKVKGAPPPAAIPVPPPAMVVQPAMQVARAMPVEDDEDEEEEQQEYRPKKKKKKGSKGASGGSNEVGMKIAIVAGILLLTLVSIVFAFWWFLRGDGKEKIIMPSPTSAVSANQRSTSSDDEDDEEAQGEEKFEIADKSLIHQDLIKRYNPESNLPGLQKDAIKESGDTLAAAVLDRVKKATVYIVTETEGGGGTGSGFFACEKGLVITNAHVIAMLDEGAKEPKSVRVYLNHGKGNQEDYKAVILKVDRKNDLAILKLPSAYNNTYPEPLQLASSHTTRETQKVFSLGFPFGNSTGKEVTVTPIAVSSLRYQNGRINAVQFAGALNPGNSGGPIVDVTGRVIGVAVRIMTERSDGGTISNTGISFGVPCDEVAALYHGRADRLDLYPPTRKGNALQLPVLLQMTEHSSRRAAPKIKITPGEEKAPPGTPSSADASALKASENKQLYAGSIDLPDLDAGKVYWIQPQVTLGENQVSWLEPLVYKPARILEDKPMPGGTGGAGPGVLKLQQRYDWNINTGRGSLTARLDYAGSTEGGTKEIKELRVGAKANDHAFAHKSLQNMWINRLGEDESFAASRGGIKLTTALKNNLNQWHDLAQLNIPSETIAVGKVWKLPTRQVVLDYLFGFDSNQQCAISCEYLGAYQQDDQSIGVIRLQGDVHDVQAPKAPYGKLSGLALVDLNTRQIVDYMLRCDARKRTTSGNSRIGVAPSIDGVMQLRLQRKES